MKKKILKKNIIKKIKYTIIKKKNEKKYFLFIYIYYHLMKKMF